MALNMCEMWSNGIKIAYYSKKFQKLTQRLEAETQTPIATGGWGLGPQTPSVIRLSTLAYSASLLSSTFPLSNYCISFRPLPLPKSWLSANRLQLQVFHSTISFPHKNFLFWKFLMTSLHVICALGPPNQKSWLLLWDRLYLGQV